MQKEDFPAMYRSADESSSKSQKHFFFLLRAHLILLVSAAILSQVSVSPKIVYSIQFIVFLATLFCSIYLAVKRHDQVWYSGRAVAESIKTVTWRYVCRAEPFEMEDTIAKRHFSQTIQEIVDQNSEVCKSFIEHLDGEQVTQVMEQLRSQNLNDRKKTYKDKRIKDQLGWYARESKSNREKSKYFFGGLIGVNFFAALSSFLHVICISISFWPTSILIAIAGSILTWMQAKKYSELASSYALAAHEISLINGQSLDAKTDSEFSIFVGDTENAFSREHTQWVARKHK